MTKENKIPSDSEAITAIKIILQLAQATTRGNASDLSIASILDLLGMLRVRHEQQNDADNYLRDGILNGEIDTCFADVKDLPSEQDILSAIKPMFLHAYHSDCDATRDNAIDHALRLIDTMQETQEALAKFKACKQALREDIEGIEMNPKHSPYSVDAMVRLLA